MARAAAYRFARISGDVIAVSRGPGAMVRRYLRRRILRAAGGKVNKL